MDTTIKPLVTVPKAEFSEKLYSTLILGGILAALAWGFFPAEINRMVELWTNRANMAEKIMDYSSADFRHWHQYLRAMLETIQMAVWGSVLAVIFSVPFGLLSAANITPQWLRFPTRRLMDSFRAINELIFALVFVSAVGLGPLAGVLALTVHTTGTLAKLFSEAVEAIDTRPVEGIRATGAGKLQEIVYGVIPQVLPLWTSYSLYRYEANVRAATVLGIVGAGGIGFYLFDAMRAFKYDVTTAIVLIIIVAVTLTDMLSQVLRNVIIDGSNHKQLIAYLLMIGTLVLVIELALADIIPLDFLFKAVS
ncbi:MAG TPA: phosphonate ABC transporter, permease protein PhnE [Desulfobulbaceae bacterium]|nr:phosphonate ABC transporter, permease protein PhnE [Desulfobulbaceae bacterium]